MNTQQTSDMARQTDRAGGRRLDSILRTLTVAVALLVFGFSAPMVFADHMGNHERPLDGSAGDCGVESSEVDSTDTSAQTQLAAQYGDAFTGSRADDADESEETVPARPFDGRPW